MEVVDGFIGSISVSIPWSALVNDNTVIEVHNLELTIQSKRRSEHAGKSRQDGGVNIVSIVIILLKSVSVEVSKLQVVILAGSSREMSQTVRID